MSQGVVNLLIQGISCSFTRTLPYQNERAVAPTDFYGKRQKPFSHIGRTLIKYILTMFVHCHDYLTLCNQIMIQWVKHQLRKLGELVEISTLGFHFRTYLNSSAYTSPLPKRMFNIREPSAVIPIWSHIWQNCK